MWLCNTYRCRCAVKYNHCLFFHLDLRYSWSSTIFLSCRSGKREWFSLSRIRTSGNDDPEGRKEFIYLFLRPRTIRSFQRQEKLKKIKFIDTNWLTEKLKKGKKINSLVPSSSFLSTMSYNKIISKWTLQIWRDSKSVNHSCILTYTRVCVRVCVCVCVCVAVQVRAKFLEILADGHTAILAFPYQLCCWKAWTDITWLRCRTRVLKMKLKTTMVSLRDWSSWFWIQVSFSLTGCPPWLTSPSARISVNSISIGVHLTLNLDLAQGHSPRGVMANVLTCDIVVCEIELHLSYYVQGKGMNLLILQAMD